MTEQDVNLTDLYNRRTLCLVALDLVKGKTDPEEFYRAQLEELNKRILAAGGKLPETVVKMNAAVLTAQPQKA